VRANLPAIVYLLSGVCAGYCLARAVDAWRELAALAMLERWQKAAAASRRSTGNVSATPPPVGKP
jgi:hypothetical protein